MKVLVIGSGAREHAIAWKLKNSASVQSVYCAPGNAGTTDVAKNIAIKVDNIPALLDFAKSEKIDLTIVGPEYPLTLGLVDEIKKHNLRIFGPTKAAAQIESSKAFSKEIILAAKVPTAEAQVFEDAEQLLNYVRQRNFPIVLKADGLQAGKGVVIAESLAQVEAGIKFIFQELKEKRILVEDFLKGKEVSFIVATDGERIIPMASSQDYKRIFDHDQGPNTGGMGTISPTKNLKCEETWVIENVMQPVLKHMREIGIPFCGFLYAGLMLCDDGSVKVLEFNARMGDPECQVIMRRMRSDLGELLFALAGAEEKLPQCSWDTKAALCLVLASPGYPLNPETGDEIQGLKQAADLEDVVLFHAGTTLKDYKILSAGGRVLSISATGVDIEQARTRAYNACRMIDFRGKQFRTDIGR